MLFCPFTYLDLYHPLPSERNIHNVEYPKLQVFSGDLIDRASLSRSKIGISGRSRRRIWFVVGRFFSWFIFGAKVKCSLGRKNVVMCDRLESVHWEEKMWSALKVAKKWWSLRAKSPSRNVCEDISLLATNGSVPFSIEWNDQIQQ